MTSSTARRLKHLALAIPLVVSACSGDEITAIQGAMVPEVGWYRYRATTRDNVLLSGAFLVSYAGADSLAGDVLAADPAGKPYLEGHFVASRGKDGSYIIQLPKSVHETSASTYAHRLYRTKEGYSCEFRDVLRGNTVTKTCTLQP